MAYCTEHEVPAPRQYLYTLASLQLFFLAFADDAVLLSGSACGLQVVLNAFVDFCDLNDLVINTLKTKVM